MEKFNYKKWILEHKKNLAEKVKARDPINTISAYLKILLFKFTLASSI